MILLLYCTLCMYVPATCSTGVQYHYAGLPYCHCVICPYTIVLNPRSQSYIVLARVTWTLSSTPDSQIYSVLSTLPVWHVAVYSPDTLAPVQSRPLRLGTIPTLPSSPFPARFGRLSLWAELASSSSTLVRCASCLIILYYVFLDFRGVSFLFSSKIASFLWFLSPPSLPPPHLTTTISSWVSGTNPPPCGNLDFHPDRSLSLGAIRIIFIYLKLDSSGDPGRSIPRPRHQRVSSLPFSQPPFSFLPPYQIDAR